MAIEHHEGTLAYHTMDSVVVGELSEWKPVAPVGLLIIDEDPKVFFDFLVDTLCLAICLWVECHQCIGHDVKHPV